jgi:hypothetical protein
MYTWNHLCNDCARNRNDKQIPYITALKEFTVAQLAKQFRAFHRVRRTVRPTDRRSEHKIRKEIQKSVSRSSMCEQ